MEDKEYLIALNMIEGLGSIRITKLLNGFNRAEDIFQSSENQLQSIAGIGRELSLRIKSFNIKALKEELELCVRKNITIVSILDKDYPEDLKNIPDAPIVLYVKGVLDNLGFNVAVIGSRKASPYGLSTAKRLSGQLASLGVTVISGMARGIDSAAHKGALEVGGRTVAALGSGLLNIYPPENIELAKQISKNGAVISEFPLRTAPLRENFPRRNRIISGLSKGVIVVEAALRSGALITADLALDQGRDIFAVPGEVDSPTSCGTNYLIKQGAKLIDSAEDVLEEYN
ncbi:MAG: DNA-processing protein DprA [Candidatus Kaelpia aquatica]|nr:DNA-processing protein DprA [Candidatus Kaelpia aquatica]